jgi:tetratricopeptide (TPR) repeat protein
MRREIEDERFEDDARVPPFPPSPGARHAPPMLGALRCVVKYYVSAGGEATRTARQLTLASTPYTPPMPHKSLGRSLAALDRGIAQEVGARIRVERLRAGMTQAKLAEGRYTKAYISALENGLAKPSLAALTFIASRLGLPVTHFLGQEEPGWSRIEADLRLVSGDWQQAADAYASLLDQESQPVRRAELERGLAEALYRLERPDETLRAASSAAAAFTDANRPADAALARYWMASALYQQENDAEARSLFRSLLDLVRGGLEVLPDWEARLLIALANIDGRSGDPARALTYLEEARAVVDGLDDRRRGTYLHSLAVGYRERGDFEAAIGLAGQALATFREIDSDRDVAMLENELALTHLALGSAARATEHIAVADEILRRIGDERARAHIVETRSQIALGANDLAEAAALAAEAENLADAMGNRKAAISASLTRARATRRLGDAAGAAAILESAAKRAREHHRPAQLREVLAEWAEVEAELGDDKAAYRLSKEALELGRP